MKWVLIISLFFPVIATAQQNFWHAQHSQNKCTNKIRQSCTAHLNAGCTQSGLYKIDPDFGGSQLPFTGYCDQTTDGGGWLLVKRLIPSADTSTSSWNARLDTTTESGTLGTTLNSSTEYHLATVSYPQEYERLMIQRYKNTPVFSRSHALSFNSDRPFKNLTKNEWIMLPAAKLNGSSVTARLRNQTSIHIYSDECTGGVGPGGGNGELGVCVNSDTFINQFWGPGFDAAQYAQQVRQLSYYTGYPGAYWSPDVGLFLFVK